VSLPDLTDAAAGRGVVVQKAKSDIYTVMLGVALTAIIIACILLWLEWKRYDYDMNASSHKATAAVSWPRQIAPSGPMVA
jgi:hypothetical protein